MIDSCLLQQFSMVLTSMDGVNSGIVSPTTGMSDQLTALPRLPRFLLDVTRHAAEPITRP